LSFHFTKFKEVINFIERNWESMTIAPRRTRSTWHTTVMRSMTREDVFTSKTENSEPYYGLREPALEKIGPYNENLKLILGPTRLNSDSRLNSSNDPQTKRGPKRKASDSAYSNQSQSLNLNAGGSGAPANKKKVDDLKKIEKLVPRFYPTDHPYNKDNYRYHLVEPDPHSPMRQKFEETEFWAGKPLPGHLYRLFLEQRVALALADKAPQLKVSDDRLGVVGEKGYSMVRATHGVMHGAWYFEVVIREKPSAAALRIGWAQQLANLQATCGFDKFSYSWRSRKGTRFHDSIGKAYSKLIDENSGYDVNDVLGFYIELPLVDNSQLLPDSCKDMTLVKFKNHLYYEEVSKIRWSCVCVGVTDSFDFFL
jgi:Set1/Ash2 histone methyltransferase complex subunit ASH2